MPSKLHTHLLLAAALAACGGSSHDSSDSGTTINCAADPRVRPYAANMVVPSTGGTLKFMLVASTPAPPIRGVNTWTLRVNNAADQPLTGLDIAVATLMPDHGHTSSVKPAVTQNADGTYKVANLDLFMPGVWKVTFTTTPPGGARDSVDFLFCVAG
jgi:hypothetical protein